MKCIIRIVNGQPSEHPITVDNFIQAFPDIDLNQPLPDGFAWFERKLRPEKQEHEVFIDEHSRYEFDGNVWTDVWRVRDKTEEEIRAEVKYGYDTMRLRAAEFMESLSDDPDGVAAWAAFSILLDEREAATPLKVRLPPPPYKNEEGVWVSVTNPGSAPNVIG
jgi:hypothetical protein